ncbi:MAG: choice-of-anchor D domain-containing protein [Terriglobales bacterium]
MYVVEGSLKPGDIDVLGDGAAQNVTLTNNLSTSLTVNSVTASGDYAVAGSGTTPCVLTGITLASKKKCTFSVTFTPTETATTITGAATVTYQAEFSPLTGALTGGGSGGTASPLTFSPASPSFKNVPIGESAKLSVTVTNSSTSKLSITGLTASGNYSAVGSAVGGNPACGGSLAAGAACGMTLTFSPSINGTNKGAVAIANSSAVNPQVYDISGSAVFPLVFSPSSLSFKTPQPAGSTSAAQTVTLANYASTTMSISIAASGDYGVLPGSKTPCGTTLEAGGKCTIGVTFTPSTTGTITGAATVTYSGVSPSFSPQELSLSGTGK